MRSASLRVIVGVVAVAALLGSCADERPSPTGASGTATGSVVTDPPIVATCGGATFPALPPDPSVFPPFDDWAAVDLSGIGMESEFFDRYDWFVADETSETLNLFGRPRTDAGDPDLYASAGFEREGDTWSPGGFGDCRIELSAEGWGNARFQLDPTLPLDPDSSTIPVLATEMNCASGQPPDDRDVRAVVLDDDAETISVVILVEPVDGAANCQGNPAFPFAVDIGSPLGERHVLDASVYPPTDVSVPRPAGASG